MGAGVTHGECPIEPSGPASSFLEEKHVSALRQEERSEWVGRGQSGETQELGSWGLGSLDNTNLYGILFWERQEAKLVCSNGH